ncbi:hypothetical protein [Comamonas odontotermitis]|uniref:hypothetical protein n=1 Tax=Comamonas odontotermitis TaxID=379895 RepID=UPI001CC7F018|nr:hypothetical protein [Comamonas odontotermitis]UBB19528.1 hypothetical protein LAD35_22245 [Comamonas odontotermitis]
MIKITERDGHLHLLHIDAIARVTEASASSQWHGVRAYVRTFDGVTIEARESALEIGRAVDAERNPSKETTQ